MPASRCFTKAIRPIEVFTVISGMLKLSKLLPDGRRQITGFLMAGDYLGLAFAERYVCSAEAVTPVRLCRFPRSAFLGLLDQFPALEKALLGRAATELAAAQQQMLLLGRKNAHERVASFVLQLAERQGDQRRPADRRADDQDRYCRLSWPDHRDGEPYLDQPAQGRADHRARSAPSADRPAQPNSAPNPVDRGTNGRGDTRSATSI